MNRCVSVVLGSTIVLACVLPLGCASSQSVHALSSAQRGAIEELALAWSGDHALCRAELGALVDIRLAAARGRIQRELIETGCLAADGDADPPTLSGAIADPGVDIALVREVRLGRMSEEDAIAWLSDYATALGLGDAADGAGVRERLLGQLADIESISRAWEELQRALDERAQRVTALAAQAAGASDALAEAIESRIAWREIGAGVGNDAIGPAIDALFTDPRRRSAARELLKTLLGSEYPSPG